MAPLQALDLALPAVAMACRLTQQLQGHVDSLDKSDGSPVTIADFTSQAVVMHHLRATAAEDSFYAEESADALRNDPQLLAQVHQLVKQEIPEAVEGSICDWIDSGRRPAGGSQHWLLDPLDGTKGFLTGGQYAVALALVVDGAPVLGILGCPHLARIFVAPPGGDAFSVPLDLAPPRNALAVSERLDPAACRILHSRVSTHSDLELQELLYSQVGLCSPPIPLDSQAKYGMVAAGEAEVFMRLPHPDQPTYVERSWDHAAGALLVAAAGGRVTDMDGRTLDFSTGDRLSANRGIIATNGGPVHDALLAAIESLDR